MYRRMQNCFSLTKHWKYYDLFYRSKTSGFKSSKPAVVELAAQYRHIITELQSSNKIKGAETQGALEKAEEILFIEMAEICLWGNKTDLSLLTNLTDDDIQKLQGAKVRKASEAKILVNHLSKAFHVLNQALKDGKADRRVDFVLDNAGFELFVDLVLAGYLLATGLATTVVLHPKDIPWFVSDVVPRDFLDLVEALRKPAEFFATDSESNLSEADLTNVTFLFDHWSSLHADGKLILRPNRFWTNGGSFWRLPQMAPELYDDLKESELVIFKGDLNYRKLIADVYFSSLVEFDSC
jgi:uncharacterized protein with ATP-grasp and redox domains